jgi:hypothetical protein
MPVEKVGDQIRIRINEPSKFSKFRTADPGKLGKLQIVLGYGKKGWETQAYRINIKDYDNLSELLNEIKNLKIDQIKKSKAMSIAKKYY